MHFSNYLANAGNLVLGKAKARYLCGRRRTDNGIGRAMLQIQARIGTIHRTCRLEMILRLRIYGYSCEFWHCANLLSVTESCEPADTLASFCVRFVDDAFVTVTCNPFIHYQLSRKQPHCTRVPIFEIFQVYDFLH